MRDCSQLHFKRRHGTICEWSSDPQFFAGTPVRLPPADKRECLGDRVDLIVMADARKSEQLSHELAQPGARPPGNKPRQHGSGVCAISLMTLLPSSSPVADGCWREEVPEKNTKNYCRKRSPYRGRKFCAVACAAVPPGGINREHARLGVNLRMVLSSAWCVCV